MKEALKRLLRRDLFGNLASTLLKHLLLTVLVIAVLVSGVYLLRQHSMKNHLPNAGGCDAIEMVHERLISMIKALKTEIATDLPPEKIVGLVWIEIELINSVLDQLREYDEGCGGDVAEVRASLEEERKVADVARLAAIAKARAALK